jgi:two-component system response regulator YesN
MDGITLMKRVRESWPEIKFAILSGYSDYEYMESSIRNEAAAYLLKPTDIDHFIEIFTELKEKMDKQRQNAIPPVPGTMATAVAPLSDAVPGTYVQLVANQVKDYINAEFSSPGISLDTIAAAVRKSPAYISRAFKEATGENYVQYLRRKRLEHARSLLDTGALVYEAANESGWTDLSHFVKQFKKAYGMTPSDYIRTLANA